MITLYNNQVNVQSMTSKTKAGSRPPMNVPISICQHLSLSL